MSSWSSSVVRALAALASLAVVGVAAPAWGAGAFTVEQLVAKNVEARGGAARLSAIKSLRLTGRVVFGSGDSPTELSYGLLVERPGRLRGEYTLQGLTAVEGWDGKEAWSLNPFGGRRDAQRESADEAKSRARDADLDGPLVGWRDKGHQVEYLGTEDVDGTPAHKLRVRLKDGDTQYRYLDPDTFLEIRVVEESRIRGVERISETDLGAYHQVAGVWLPLSMESGPKGRPRGTRVTFDRAEVNVPVDADLFAFPPAGSPLRRAVVAAANAPLPSAAAPSTRAGAPVFDSGVVSGLGARNIGSAAMSGRISTVAAFNSGGRTTLYVGAASGGVWKSTDSGTTFKPVFDRMPVQSIGAIAVDPSKHDTVWVGSGEAWTRNSVSIGDGIYKSTDGGESWTRMGLASSERIVRILVHPKNGDVVYACVPGRLWSDGDERGVYKTSDGGKSWSKVLAGANLSTGCSSLAMDPQNPEVLLAGMWDFRRKGWTFRSGPDVAGGDTSPGGSGLFRSSDGGATWKEQTGQAQKGLPDKPWGRVEVAIAPSDAKVVYALIEGKVSGLYRSSDGGATWEARDRSQSMVWRPFYFARLVVDPRNAERLFKAGGGLIVSEDGGRSFAGTSGRSHGDWHDVWIDPDNAQHVVGGDDGGFWISHDGGSRWWKNDTLPVSQFYHVSVDDKDPYQVYGGLQDNSSWIGDSSAPGGITSNRWTCIPQGDGFWVVVDPLEPEWVYSESQGGYITRWNRQTGALRDIQPKAGYREKLRFNWNTPIVASTNDRGVLYLGGQFVFKSTDRGDTWERISPDLTTNDPAKQKQEQSGGITVDNSSAEMHTTIYTISESPQDGRVLWVGTDDGRVQLTRDGGKRWNDVTRGVAGLPPASWVSWIEASRFDPGTAYATFDRHTFGDHDPWVYVTRDYGASWRRIVGPASGVRGWAHVIKEDSASRALLFLGTELGLWISADGGASWAEWKGGNFPSVAVRDLAVQAREGDLVVATHGRGIWILDDLSPLRALTPEVLKKGAAFLPGRRAQQRMPAAGGWVTGDAAFVGENPAGGAVLTYYQRSRHLYGPLKLEILDDKGKVVDTLPASRRRGINRVVWSMQAPPPRVPRAAQVAGNATRGPRLPPGTYTARLTKGTDVVETRIAVEVDRRANYFAEDRATNFQAAMRAHALFGEMSGLCDRLDGAMAASTERAATLGDKDALSPRLRAAAEKLGELKRKIVATKEGGAITGEERLREHLDILYGALLQWEGRPARYQVERIDTLARELSDVAHELDELTSRELRPLDEELKARKLGPISSAPAPARVPEGELAFRCLHQGGEGCAPEGAIEPAAEAR